MASLGARDRLLLRGGVLGPVLFVAVFLVEAPFAPTTTRSGSM